MERLLWIGPRRPPAELKPLMAGHGVELLSFPDVDAALRATAGIPVALAVVNAEWENAPEAIRSLKYSRPDVEVLAACDLGVPRPLLRVLEAGANGLLEFRTQSRGELLSVTQSALARHRVSARERELLLRLRGLNEEFLRAMVAAQKRSLELEDQLTREQPEAETADAEEGPARVLVVDDEDVVRGVLQRILEKRGHRVILAEDAESAVNALAAERFQLVISDKNLPGMTGLDLLKDLKQRAPDTDLILMTGYASMDSAIEALNLGAAGYLEKPFEHVSAVAEKIEAVIAAQREKVKKRRYLNQIKERNRSFLDQYRMIRADLEAWLETRGGTRS